ncbi:hypothetical protein [Archangium violaceum]|uniref:Uncharacterized protein n=1 Tax=Archangium violaceum Cb vi76 TaxID=1406225 RepID=A0A084SM83_9BACT|nr:hypothetical protein [Archangium violaceum]KFA89568.1 hypothetical protein Q664_33960 [Archangium violaceum Cb vi76]
MYESALRDLYASAKLQPNQVVMDLREHHAIHSFVFYCSHSITISGYVFQLSPTAPGALKVSSASISQ